MEDYNRDYQLELIKKFQQEFWDKKKSERFLKIFHASISGEIWQKCI